MSGPLCGALVFAGFVLPIVVIEFLEWRERR
jgi:hypothetical protein